MRKWIPLVFLGLVLTQNSNSAQRQRCGTLEPEPLAPGEKRPPSDCGYSTNTPRSIYDPNFYYYIPVVFHVIQTTTGEGYLSPSTIQDQVDVLNEDFQAIAGSPGAPGVNSMIRFYLANKDPSGNATSGITYSTNNNWYQDSGNYWTPLAWDTHRYLNIYTNAPPCCFGYVQDFPTMGIVGDPKDRVVLWSEAVGRQGTPGWPLNMGRTASHEVGHYLGLYHTFCGGCGRANDCDGTGDLICDTNPQANPTSGCPGSQSSCGSPDPTQNYMDYTDDPCLSEFTAEQVNRMRCTLENWRPDVFTSVLASETLRLGVPPNPNALVPGMTSAPIIGMPWDPKVDHTTFATGASLDFLAVSVMAPINTVIGFGTLLIVPPGPTQTFFVTAGQPFSIPIPNQIDLIGFTAYCQAGSITPGSRVELTNGLDIVVGTF